MKDIAIVYGSNGGNTECAAKLIKEKIGENAKLFDVSSINNSDLDTFENIIFGTSTWGVGDLQDDWEGFIADLENVNLNGKTIALFGLGDGVSFSSTFIDGVGIIYDTIKNKACNIIGQCETKGYSFDDSTALEDGCFVGLALDEDNESELSETRIEKWVEEILPAFK